MDDNNPYGYLQEDGPLKDVPYSVIHRFIQSRPPGFLEMNTVPKGMDNTVSYVDTLPVIVEDNAVVYVDEQNKKLIEGLLANSTPREDAYLNLNEIRSRIETRKSTHQRSSISPKPSSLREESPNDTAVENVIPIEKSDVQKSFDATELLSKQMGDLSVEHLNLILSFDNASSYLEAFAKDALGIQGEISVDEHPFNFIRQMCSVNLVSSYADKLAMPDEYKKYFMEKTIDYFAGLAQRESDAALKMELLRRTNNSQRSKGTVSSERYDDTETPSSAHGAIIKRNK